MAFDHVGSPSSTQEATVLVIGLDDAHRRAFATLFEGEGFTALEADGPAAAARLVASQTIDLVVFDARASDGQAYGYCRASAVEGGAPIILLSDKADTVSRIVALEVGADEVLPAGVDERLLLAQARAMLRRARQSGTSRRARTDGWSVDPQTRLATAPSGARIGLARHQVRLMRVFLENAGEVITAERIAAQDPSMHLEPAAFRTAMSRLRRRLATIGGEDFIRIVRGSGYVHAPTGPG